MPADWLKASEYCDFENAKDDEGAHRQPHDGSTTRRGRPALENEQRRQQPRPAKVNDDAARQAEPMAARCAFDKQCSRKTDEQRAAHPRPEAGIGTRQAEDAQRRQRCERQHDAGGELQQGFKPKELLHLSDAPMRARERVRWRSPRAPQSLLSVGILVFISLASEPLPM